MEYSIDPGVKELPKVDVLEQRSDYIKSRMEYSNGFILITEMVGGAVHATSNFNFKTKPDGQLTPDFTSPNNEFVDVI